jgi:hypothetical protein
MPHWVKGSGFLCKKCGVHSKSLDDWRHHQNDVCTKFTPRRNVNAKKHMCKTCDATFDTRRLLRRHQKDVHGTRAQYPCPICYETFVSFKVAEKHKEQVHEFAFRCEFPGCLFKSKRRETIEKHFSTPGFKDHYHMSYRQCTLCMKGFFNSFDHKFHDCLS